MATGDLRANLLGAIAQEHLLYQRMEEHRTLAERWARRADLALRLGDQEMTREALERKRRAEETARTYGQQYHRQERAVRELKRSIERLGVPPAPPARPDFEKRLAHLEQEDQLERDLAALKRQLGLNGSDGQALPRGSGPAGKDRQ